jgi:hypothetical protein
MMNIKNYHNLKYDWMGFKITKGNPLTSHHIKKAEDGGEDVPDNTAALTVLAHRYLHEQIELDSLDYYDAFNYIFETINKSRKYPSRDQLEYTKKIILEYEKKYYNNIKKRINNFNFNPKYEKYLPEDISLDSPIGYRLLISRGIDPVRYHKVNKYRGIRYKKH